MKFTAPEIDRVVLVSETIMDGVMGWESTGGSIGGED